MAITTFGTNDSQTVKIWSKKAMKEALAQTLFFKKFLGTDKDSIIVWQKELEKNSGDTVKYDLLIELEGEGTSGDNLLKGNEEDLTYYQDTVAVKQLRHATMFGADSQQKTVHDLRKDGQWALSRWWAKKFESFMFRYLCGDTAVNHAQQGGTVAGSTAFDSDHVVYGGDATSEGTIGSNDQFTLDQIDYAKEKTTLLDQPMVPVRIDGDEYYVVVLHPYSMTDLKLDIGGTSSSTWMEIQKDANVRGAKNPIFTGAAGVYNKCIIFESKDIFTPSTSVRRNLFLGANAGVFAMGNAYKKQNQKKYGDNNLISWNEMLDDYDNREGISAGCTFGIKKCSFNSKDFGVITMPCRANSTHN